MAFDTEKKIRERGAGTGGETFKGEATFAGPHDLGMLLRWGLARIVRVTQGVETRGLFGYETYLEWRKAERGMIFF